MKVSILNVLVDSFTKDEAKEKLKNFLHSDKAHFLVTPNPEIIMVAQKDPTFLEILNKASLSLPDGIGLKMAGWYLKRPIKERITGVDFINEMAKLVEKEKMSLYLLGAEKGIAEKAAKNLKEKYPDLVISGTSSGQENSLTNQSIIDEINQKRPDVLLVALGAPKQEKWIYEHLPLLKTVKVAMGVGGSFDFLAGKVKRAPLLMRAIGLEWLFRLMVEPWRLKRIITATIKFTLAVIKEKRKNEEIK